MREKQKTNKKNSKFSQNFRCLLYNLHLSPLWHNALKQVGTFGVILLDGSSSEIASKMATSIEIPLRDTEDEVQNSLDFFVNGCFQVEAENFVFVIR